MLTPKELEELLNDYDESKKQIQKLKKDLAKYRFEKSYLLKEEVKNQVKLLSIHSQCRFFVLFSKKIL